MKRKMGNCVATYELTEEESIPSPKSIPIPLWNPHLPSTNDIELMIPDHKSE